ncbi:hypothetical protein [Pseudomonas amygdali]|uniref:Uncharacterized protein n=1 Tax=Pseudomonas amygdali pv. lachrymans str. M301315 TaxID=629260 RepID=A0AAD0PVQ9_PSEAV|nr:hypothetical protein [Pseudomonas amygdali]AXH59383.1 hypothetical protein PLA107_029600 [Pseudomonas amygdali pv. lachrymans str. M301315]
MDLLEFSPFDLDQRLELLHADLNAAQAKISDLLGYAPSGESPDDPTRHIQLDILRFERNSIRSRILDVAAVQDVRKQNAKTQALVNFLSDQFPTIYQEIVSELHGNGFSEQAPHGECAMISQQIEQCYRTLEASHKDQISMMTQIHENSHKLSEMGDWIDRVNHALTTSRSFFSRKCHLVRKLRDQLSTTLLDKRSSVMYSMAVARQGHGFVDSLHQMMAVEKRVAA